MVNKNKALIFKLKQNKKNLYFHDQKGLKFW